MIPTEAYEKFNFFRAPNWRWRRVLQLADRRPMPARPTRFDDEQVRLARNFLLRYRATEPEDRINLFMRDPGLHSAYELYVREQTEPDVALILQARLLSGAPIKQIAEVTGVLPQSVEWYEALFFNVRPYRAQRDWIVRQVLIPAITRSAEIAAAGQWGGGSLVAPFLDGSLKMFAYFGGPVVCEFFIHGCQLGACPSADQLSDYLDRHWAGTVRGRSCQAARVVPLREFNVADIFNVHAKLIELDKADDTAVGRKNAIETHVGALLDEVGLSGWSAGDPALLMGTPAAEYAETAAELRDDELLEAAAGQSPARAEEIKLLQVPPPKSRKRPAELPAAPAKTGKGK